MWISVVWYNFRRSGADLITKIRTYEEDNCHQPAAYPGVLSDLAITDLGCHDLKVKANHGLFL
jgi:hypothetical protein